MKLPAECRLLSHTIRIEVIDPHDWPHGENCVGVWMPPENRIELVRQGESGMMHALCHELTHAVLGMMNSRLYANEVFVDQFGGMLAQILSTLEPVKPRRKTARKSHAR